MDQEWVGGFWSGVLATVIGFLLTVLWDFYKWRRDSKKQEEAMFSAAADELKNNIRILKRNTELLTQELGLLEQNMVTLNPLPLLRAGAWDLIKIHHPNFLLKNDLLSHINKAVQLIEEVNEGTRSRELYRQTNGAMSNYNERMKKYDQLLLELNAQLLSTVSELETKTDKFVKEKQ
jgi:hypothetical protein